MAEVDPNDDTIRRWVIYHYRYDPARRQRRYVVVGAYDGVREFEREMRRYSEQIDAEISAGTRSDRERVSGGVLERGYLAEQARWHDVKRAMAHGVDPERFFRSGPLPSTASRYRESRLSAILRAVGISIPPRR